MIIRTLSEIRHGFSLFPMQPYVVKLYCLYSRLFFSLDIWTQFLE